MKPEFWEDQELAEQVSRDARLLYIGLWNLADEHGRLRGDARFVRGRVFPYDDDLEIDDVTMLLAELAMAGKVLPYRTGAGIFLFLPNLSRHQRLETDKVASRLPDPFAEDAEALPPRALIDACRSESRANKSARRAEKMSLLYGAWSMEHVSADAAGAAQHAHTDEGDSATDASSDDGEDEPDTKAGPKARVKEGKLPSTHPKLTWSSQEIDADPEWIKFWAVYPNIKDKNAARTKWLTALRQGATTAQILAGAEAYAIERASEDPKFNKNAATWLHNRCWEQYDEEPKPGAVRDPDAFWEA